MRLKFKKLYLQGTDFSHITDHNNHYCNNQPLKQGYKTPNEVFSSNQLY